jgi:hypothetical protein
LREMVLKAVKVNDRILLENQAPLLFANNSKKINNKCCSF